MRIYVHHVPWLQTFHQVRKSQEHKLLWTQKFHFPGFKVQSASLGKEGKQEHSTADKDSSASCEQVSFNTCDNLFMVRSVTPDKSDNKSKHFNWPKWMRTERVRKDGRTGI